MTNEKIFKAYDIRGIYGTDFDERSAKKIGQAFANLIKGKKIVVGRDMRVSSPSLAEAVIQGLISQGVNVVDIGMVSTPLFNFSVGYVDAIKGGIHITASHNPGEYNGMKMVYGNVLPVGQGSGMEELKDMVMNKEFTDKHGEEKGKIEYMDLTKEYLDRVFSMIDVNKIKEFKIAVDTGNGINGPMIQEICAKLPQINLLPLYFRPDGTFPNHEANPLKHETLKDIQNIIVKESAKVGFAFDGDGDRVGVLDEHGDVIPGDFLTALIAKFLIEKKNLKGALILHDLRSSWVVKEIIEHAGGRAEPTMVGHSNIKKAMKEKDGFFAGELSNHYYYKDFYNVETADLTMLLILQMMSEYDKPFSEIVAPLRKYYQSGEINSEVEDKEGIMKKLETLYSKGALEVSLLDGIKIEHPDYWFNVRPSNTEPVLRLNLEARTKEKMEKMRDEILGVIRGGK